MRGLGPGSDMLAHMLERDLAVVVVGCTAHIVVVVGPDTTVQASAGTVSLLLLPFPCSTPQTDGETQPDLQKAQRAVRGGMVL